ncbi:MAG TPA: COX aromatic rich motif-containing protein, partial [Candidatus Paceibacterota bacterium]|nr:COX aromatic rich motif-containing protein [Candidatus Paceibacterota bacterium]
VTTLNLVADAPGVYAGGSSNFSGDGFAHMKFDTRAVAPQEFDAWVHKTQTMPAALDSASYARLAKASVEKEPLYYGDTQAGLFERVVSTFMPAMGGSMDMDHHH